MRFYSAENDFKPLLTFSMRLPLFMAEDDIIFIVKMEENNFKRKNKYPTILDSVCVATNNVI